MDLSMIGKRIRSARESKSWRQEDLAEKIDKSNTYIGMIERGERIPKLETFLEIINVLDVSADEILYDVTKHGYKVRLSKYAERIKNLSPKDEKLLYEIVEIFLNSK